MSDKEPTRSDKELRAKTAPRGSSECPSANLSLCRKDQIYKSHHQDLSLWRLHDYRTFTVRASTLQAR